ncbi:hypothetical protein K474DRAFT_1669529 [Panus rudis PR-1116 ss-1]|nr:hypothetical protein K474DRAFT_1669529 [Panus rudis PR-1116 ss-1]
MSTSIGLAGASGIQQVEAQREDNEYHAVGTNTASVLEDEDQFGDFDAGDDVGRHCDLDAGAIHDDDARDAGIESDNDRDSHWSSDNFYRDEHGEYEESMVPEDDDEMFGEALAEDYGGQGGTAYGRDPPGGPIAVDEMNAVLPGSEEWS